MEIDKVFNNDVDGVADNLFSAVKNSVSEIKAMQQRKAAENVQLVIQALKKIESDLQDKFDGVTTVIEKRVSTIKDGRDGVDGRNGRDGKDGRPGRDGTPGARGPAGVPGTNGRDGEDGVSVTDAKIDFDGSLIISLSSGREINVGEVVAPDLADKIKVITNGGGTSQDVLDAITSLENDVATLQAEVAALEAAAFDVGSDANELPLNQYLGEMAYMNAEAVVIQPQASVVPNGAGDMVFQLTSNTSLEIKVKGSDGTVRSVALTLT